MYLDQTVGLADRDHAKETMIAFEPKIEGVKRSSLIEFKDECGSFYIGWIGGMPEREHAFYYADGEYEFCFYAEQHRAGTQYDVVIENATIYAFHGLRPQINPADFERVRRNMARYFSDRWFFIPTKPMPATEKFSNVVLAWRLS